MMGLFFPLITACILFLVRKNKYQIPIINHCKIEIEKICRNLANKYTVPHFVHFINLAQCYTVHYCLQLWLNPFEKATQLRRLDAQQIPIKSTLKLVLAIKYNIQYRKNLNILSSKSKCSPLFLYTELFVSRGLIV